MIEDDHGAVARLHPGKNTSILLRPDGYLAWRSRQADASGLAIWLDKTLRIKVVAAFGSDAREQGTEIFEGPSENPPN